MENTGTGTGTTENKNGKFSRNNIGHMAMLRSLYFHHYSIPQAIQEMETLLHIVVSYPTVANLFASFNMVNTPKKDRSKDAMQTMREILEKEEQQHG